MPDGQFTNNEIRTFLAEKAVRAQERETLKVLLCRDGARAPERLTPGAACYDVYAPTGFDLPRGKIVEVHAGVKLALPPNTVGRLLPRSSLARKGVVVMGGVIDPDYRGEVIVVLKNTSQQGLYIAAGDRMCQLAIYPTLTPAVQVVTSLDDTARGEGGFGSTGR